MSIPQMVVFPTPPFPASAMVCAIVQSLLDRLTFFFLERKKNQIRTLRETLFPADISGFCPSGKADAPQPDRTPEDTQAKRSFAQKVFLFDTFSL
jgi:hypothetical protein